ncbi:1-phosphatidylinositol 4,5-bisphosphate phosphodiesterase beta-3 isoform X3 [Fundulus heteroclitus]|uniref:1-phosphatidylinositol 4,5-bisphosphate phosphodiesterase beta-3 isoform X3 n=1 Tax=Fundulus heteroclitus TaxID=8078 RepID=UPI00165C54A3|nr:1-phosphatidylinositol 4,5-bisphosphate phosphodiesterase beta-3 isoform X3 [Fundulus heteroclitus]
MAGAKPGVHALQLKPVSVHEELSKGSKFIRWDEDSSSSPPTLGNLKVDSEGFFLTWTTASSYESEIFDISTIRDTRTGKYAKQPKDHKLREQLGYKEDSSSKLLTIVYGHDLVNISFICLLALSEESAKVWTEELFSLATNILSQNASRNTYLLKAYTKIKLQASSEGKIPTKSFLKLFSDKKRVETALEQSGLIVNKLESVKLEAFTWKAFLLFLDMMCYRPELQNIFAECGAKSKPFINLDQFMEFINEKQRDPRLNEVLYPPLKREQVRQIMEKYETNASQLERDQISLQAFGRYLGGDENGIVPPEKLDLIDDMNQPLAHYFINSSHNTYLTVGQLTGLSSVEMYRQVLLTGCRCIELDCWKGRPPDEEPYITHGYTMTTEISFKEVLEAIAESAFKTSQYPLILSFENHVDSAKQQAKMAEYCRTIFGDALLIDPLEKYPLVKGQQLPSPQDLLGKILIKNKKKRLHPVENSSIRRKEPGGQSSLPSDSPLADREGQQLLSNGDQKLPAKDMGRREGESEEEEEDEPVQEIKKPASDEGTASSEAVATEEMSTLVNYIEPVKFKGFDAASYKKKYFEMSSFVETKGLEALKNAPIDFVEYNKNQLSRIYPKGTRVDSSNYMPQIFWNAGCQMVALNFQTLDLAMQLNMGVFEYNGHCGYLLKPEFMRRADKHFDPFTESIVDGIVANTVTIKVISGQFLTDKKVGVYVEIDMFGLPTDTKRKFRTRTSNGNSLDPTWHDDEIADFYHVVLPTLASLRIAAFEENGKFIGHRILPVSAIRPGYHYINLKNELNQPLFMPSLLVYVEAKDYVPNEHQEYADALTNPIKHISKLCKRELQLAALLEDMNQEIKAEGTPQDVASPIQPVPDSVFDECPEESKISGVVQPAKDCKEDLVSTVLSEPPCLSLDDLKTHKSYTKVKKRQSKELGELQKKNQKKIQSETQKKRSMIDKTFKRSIKKSDSQDGPPRDVEKETHQLREQQLREVLALRQALYELEAKMREEHFLEEMRKLKSLASEIYQIHEKKLKETCEREKKEIQKILERKRINSIVEAKGRDKAEVDQNEINRKHIQESVDALRRLERAQEARQEKYTMKYQELVQQLETTQYCLLSRLDEELDAERRRLPEEICQQFDVDPKEVSGSKSLFSLQSNHSTRRSAPPSNCSTPNSQSSPFWRTPNKSMDSSLASLADSTSSSTTPDRSVAELYYS